VVARRSGIAKLKARAPYSLTAKDAETFASFLRSVAVSMQSTTRARPRSDTAEGDARTCQAAKLGCKGQEWQLPDIRTDLTPRSKP